MFAITSCVNALKVRNFGRAKLWRLALGLMILTLSLAISPGRLAAAFPGTNGKIAVETNRDGVAQIYVMNADGTNPTNISNSSDYEGEPAWSSDGTKITFIKVNGGEPDIYAMNADGTGKMQLTTDPATDEIPSWSPDGSKIIFYSRRDGHGQIYVMNADGTNQVNVSNNSFDDAAGKFSPDGSKIVFQSTRSGGFDIFVMNADGSNPFQLTSGGGYLYPSWSPDGSKLLFYGGSDLWTVNSDGSNLTRLTFGGVASGVAAWSPDGTKITFDSTIDGNYEVYVMNADGTGQTNITNNAAVDFRPDWGVGTAAPPASQHDLKQGVLNDITALRATVVRKQDKDKLDRAIEQIGKSLAPALWTDGNHLNADKGKKVFEQEKDAVGSLLDLIKDKKSTIPDATLQGFVDRLTAIDRALATIAINDAITGGGNAHKIAEANKELGKGDADASHGKSETAIEHYGNAWDQAIKALAH